MLYFCYLYESVVMNEIRNTQTYDLKQSLIVTISIITQAENSSECLKHTQTMKHIYQLYTNKPHTNEGNHVL